MSSRLAPWRYEGAASSLPDFETDHVSVDYAAIAAAAGIHAVRIELLSPALHSLDVRCRVRWRSEQQHRTVGWRDAVGHDERVVVDALAAGARLGHRRRDRQGADLHLLPLHGPRQRRIV